MGLVLSEFKKKYPIVRAKLKRICYISMTKNTILANRNFTYARERKNDSVNRERSLLSSPENSLHCWPLSIALLAHIYVLIYPCVYVSIHTSVHPTFHPTVTDATDVCYS